MNEKLLEEIGFTKGEIKVYLTLLKLGETTTGKIIEEAQISSGKIYEILDKLIKKGLVSYIIKEKTKYFAAASPTNILAYMQEKEKKLKEKEAELKKELPSLLALQKSKQQKHETTLFTGLKGIQSAIFEGLGHLNSKDELLAMGVRGSKGEEHNLLWFRWHEVRIKRKIKSRILFSEKHPYFHKLKKMKYLQIKLLEGITPSAVTIMGQRVFIFSFGKEPSVLLIKNSEIAKSFTTFFETLWKTKK